MPVPSPRNKILPARGNYSDLAANVASIFDGEICYAIDQDQYYQKEGSALVAVGATKAQGLLADSAVQPGDNISGLTNDAGYITDYTVTSGDVTAHEGDLTIAQSQVTGLATDLSNKADLVGGVIPNSQLPSLAISEYLGTAADQAGLLALSGQRGDWAIRTDTGSTWVITTDGGSTLTDWTELATPADAVTSVNGFQGTVVLGAADVDAVPVTGGQFTGDIEIGTGIDLNADGSASFAGTVTVGDEVRASTGILFGTDTAAVNTLDDYEEGTWTPALSPLVGTFTGSYSEQTGQYTKIGNRVFLSGRITLASTGGTGTALLISGLPFAVSNDIDSGVVGDTQNFGSRRPTCFRVNQSNDQLFLRALDAILGIDNVDVADLTSNSSFMFSIVYKV